MNAVQSTTLYFKQGSSDKVYVAKLSETDGGHWTVTFAYGRRGKPMKQGVKTKQPVPYTDALKIYEALIHAKQLKGYTVDGDAIAFTDNPNAGEDTGFRPQLLNEVTQEEAEEFYLCNFGDVAMQIKWDGERRAAILDKGKDNIFTNRKGQVKGVIEAIDRACTKLISNRPLVSGFELDTEDMGEFLAIFDITRIGNIDMKSRTFRERAETMGILENIIEWEGLGDRLKLELPFYPQSLNEFRLFIEEARAHNEEGVVIRLASAPYEPGRPNSGGNCLKLKFVGECTCEVSGHVAGKRSVTLRVRKDDATGPDAFIPIGKVTIPPNYDIPERYDLVEIKYMNIMRGEGAKLFQPRYKGLRTDKTEADFYSSLKFKKE